VLCQAQNVHSHAERLCRACRSMIQHPKDSESIPITIGTE